MQTFPRIASDTEPGFSSHLFSLCAESFCLVGITSYGGDDGIRTHDPLLAGQVLSQLSYTPKISFGRGRISSSLFSSVKKEACNFLPTKDVGIELSSRTVSRKVLSPLQSLTSVFGMGTGGPSAFVTPTIYLSRTLWSLKIEQQFPS